VTFLVGISVGLAYSVVYFVPLSSACYRAYFAASLVVPLFSAFGKELSCSEYHHHADCFSMLLCRNQLLYQTACSNDKPLQHCDRTKHGDIYLIRKKLDETIKATKTNAELIGGLGGKVFSKNRASGQANRTIELGTDYIEVGHNGNGFEVGKEYTISWSAECTPYGHRNVTVNVQSVFFVENGHVVLRPVDTRFPTIEHDINKSNRVVPMVYYGDYNIEYSGNWFKPVPVRKTISAGDEVVVIPHTYKPIIDSNGANATVTTWSDNPQIIIDGGSA